MKKVAMLILAIALISGFEARSQSKADSLARFNGEWKIINVLWGWLPRPNDK